MRSLSKDLKVYNRMIKEIVPVIIYFHFHIVISEVEMVSVLVPVAFFTKDSTLDERLWVKVM